MTIDRARELTQQQAVDILVRKLGLEIRFDPEPGGDFTAIWPGLVKTP